MDRPASIAGARVLSQPHRNANVAHHNAAAFYHLYWDIDPLLLKPLVEAVIEANPLEGRAVAGRYADMLRMFPWCSPHREAIRRELSEWMLVRCGAHT